MLNLTVDKINQIKQQLIVDPTLSHSTEILGLSFLELVEAIKTYPIIDDSKRSTIVRRTLTQRHNAYQKWGKPTNFAVPELRERYSKTAIARHGSATNGKKISASRLEHTKEQKEQHTAKIKATKIERYGRLDVAPEAARRRTAASQSPDSKAKRKATCIVRYGTLSPSLRNRKKWSESMQKRHLTSGRQGTYSEETRKIIYTKESFVAYINSLDKRTLSKQYVGELLGMSASAVCRFAIKYDVQHLFTKRSSSQPEQQLYEIITSWGFTVLRNKRKAIKPYELDLYIEEKKVAVEYDGAYWHSFSGRQERDRIKDAMCFKAGITLIRIKEEDFLLDPDSQVIRIFNALGVEGQLVLSAEEQISNEEQFFYDIEVKEDSHNYLTSVGIVHNSFQYGQDVRSAGIPCKHQSIDRVDRGLCIPYSVLRNFIYDKRIKLLPDEEQFEELTRLIKLGDGHVTQPKGGHDDLSQGLCGAVYLASQHTDTFLSQNSIDLIINSTSAQSESGPIIPNNMTAEQAIYASMADVFNMDFSLPALSDLDFSVLPKSKVKKDDDDSGGLILF